MKQKFIVEIDMKKGFKTDYLRLALIGMMIKVIRIKRVDKRKESGV